VLRSARVMIVAVFLFFMSACAIAAHHSRESGLSLAPENNISQLAANDCNEQTRLLKHEIALCRAVPLITLPLQ